MPPEHPVIDMKRQVSESALLDRIDVHYSVDIHMEFEGRDFLVVKASFELIHTLGAGVPTRGDMARLVMARGVQASDVVDVCGRRIDRSEAAHMIRGRGLKEEHVKAMRIRRVEVDGVVAAKAMD